MTDQGQSTVATHAVTSNANVTRVQLRESRKDSLRQLLADVAVHVVAGVVGSLGGVDVEASTGAKVIGVILALNVQTTLKILH